MVDSFFLKVRGWWQKVALRKGVFLFPLLSAFLLLTCLMRVTHSAGVERIRVISAGATSATDHSLPVAYLLDPAKKGFWQPKAGDEGVNEGLFFQFDTAVLIDYIEVKLENAEGREWGYRIAAYLDGQRLTSDQETADGIWYGFVRRREGTDLILRCGVYSTGEELLPLRSKVRSVFLKIEAAEKKPKVTSVRFYREGYSGPLPVEIPLLVQGTAAASSTLTPEPAYTVFNLFDSREDFAWSTHGKQTDGIGEEIKVLFADPQTLSGLLVWNGYQRSETHFQANARPASLKVIVNGGKEFVLPVKDLYGSQVIRFPEVVKEVEELVLRIERVYPGGSYRDVLISELKFLDEADRIINLQTPHLEPEVTDRMAGILDITLAPFLLGLGGEYSFYDGYYPFRSIRFRSNGSFVIYENIRDEIMEGNWEPKKEGTYIFGKRYMTNPRDSEYLQAVREKRAVRIFSANLTIQKVSSIPFEKAKKYLQTMLEDRDFSGVHSWYSQRGRPVFWWTGLDPYGGIKIEAETAEEFMRRAYELAVEQDAFLIASPLFVDLFVPLNQTTQTYDFGY